MLCIQPWSSLQTSIPVPGEVELPLARKFSRGSSDFSVEPARDNEFGRKYQTGTTSHFKSQLHFARRMDRVFDVFAKDVLRYASQDSAAISTSCSPAHHPAASTGGRSEGSA